MLSLCYEAVRVVLQRPDAINSFQATRATVLRSFMIVALLLPLYLLLSYFAYRGILAEKQVGLPLFLAHRTGIYVLDVVLSLWLVYWAARWQGVGAHYLRWVEGSNYLALAKCIYNVPVTVWALTMPLESDLRQAVGLGLFLFTIYVNWAMTTRAFAVSLFIGAGLTVLPMMSGTLLSDYSNLKLFGEIRPLLPADVPELLVEPQTPPAPVASPAQPL